MKKLFIIANWKSNKTISETEAWLHKFHKGFLNKNINLESKEIIVAPSFTSLEHANYCSSNLKLPIKFAAQNISPFAEGAYTGEINGRQIKELADYVIIGHSERREHFSENDKTLVKKVSQAVRYNLTPVFCVQNEKTLIPKEANVIAYEPVEAIGTGNPDTPENADNIAFNIKINMGGIRHIIYGGSVTSKNVKSFTQMPNISGVLVGGASLDPLEFLKIIENA